MNKNRIIPTTCSAGNSPTGEDTMTAESPSIAKRAVPWRKSITEDRQKLMGIEYHVVIL